MYSEMYKLLYQFLLIYNHQKLCWNWEIDKKNNKTASKPDNIGSSLY